MYSGESPLRVRLSSSCNAVSNAGCSADPSLAQSCVRQAVLSSINTTPPESPRGNASTRLMSGNGWANA